MNAQPRISSLSLQGPRTGLGYNLAETEQEEQRALDTAFDLLKTARLSGIQLRSWAKRKAEEVGNKLRWIRTRNLMDGHPLQAGIRAEMEQNLMKVETDVVEMLSQYMRTMSELKQRVELLNPPLSVRQIKPFVNALDFDQRFTVTSLQPLQTLLHQWQAICPTAQPSS